MAIQDRTEVRTPRSRLDIAAELVVVEKRMKANSELVSSLSRKFHLPDAESRNVQNVQLSPLLSQMKNDMALFKALKSESSNLAA